MLASLRRQLTTGPLTAAVVAAVGAALLFYFGPYLLVSLELEDLPALLRQMDALDREAAELDRQEQALLLRVATKEQAIGELLAGRLTLLQTAERYRDANAAPPYPLAPRNRVMGELLCQQVIAHAKARLAQRAPEQGPAVVARLEAEFHQLRGPDGTVRLPD